MVAANLMFHTIDVQRATRSQDSSGGQVDTWDDVYSDLPCNLQPVSNKWLVQYAAKSINVTHTVYFNSNPTILNGDRMVFDSRLFYVQGIRDLITLGRILAVDLLEIAE